MVLPTTKASPVDDMRPSRSQRTYRFIWSRGWKPRASMRLSARHRVIAVSSVHSPGLSLNAPPPTMSSIGMKLPGLLNSSVVPTASPVATPSRQPRYRA